MSKQVKIVILGSAGVGKSSLTNRFINNQFNENMAATLGAVFFEKEYVRADGQVLRLQFWDTAGQEKFRSIAKIYYKDAKAAILMYDVASRETFDGMKIWMEELKEKGPERLALAIVGNKTDILEHQVPVLEAQEYASANGALFKLISVKENKGIDELFESLASQIDKPTEQARQSIVKVKPNKKKNREDSKCC